MSFFPLRRHNTPQTKTSSKTSTYYLYIPGSSHRDHACQYEDHLGTTRPAITGKTNKSSHRVNHQDHLYRAATPYTSSKTRRHKTPTYRLQTVLSRVRPNFGDTGHASHGDFSRLAVLPRAATKTTSFAQKQKSPRLLRGESGRKRPGVPPLRPGSVGGAG